MFGDEVLDEVDEEVDFVDARDVEFIDNDIIDELIELISDDEEVEGMVLDQIEFEQVELVFDIDESDFAVILVEKCVGMLDDEQDDEDVDEYDDVDEDEIVWLMVFDVMLHIIDDDEVVDVDALLEIDTNEY